MKNRLLVCGVGINDSDYVVQVKKDVQNNSGVRKQKVVWNCHFYQSWSGMLKRCYSEKRLKRNPTYIGCSVSEEWKVFTNFRAWMVEQDWEGLQLDKDLLVNGNKVYSRETCVFVSNQVNIFLTERGNDRGEWPIGVNWDNGVKKFIARCSNPFTGKRDHLGYFLCYKEAHAAWLAKKLEHAHALAGIQKDTRVAIALIERYENYEDVK